MVLIASCKGDKIEGRDSSLFSIANKNDCVGLLDAILCLSLTRKVLFDVVECRLCHCQKSRMSSELIECLHTFLNLSWSHIWCKVEVASRLDRDSDPL